MTTDPPRAAIWMLKQFGCSPNNQSVIGDLVEGYKQGQTALWFWKQTFTAIAVSFFGEIWRHKLLALSAVLVGWIWKVVGWSAAIALPGKPTISGGTFHPPALTLRLLSLVLMILVTIGSGWIVARISRTHRKPMVILYLASELFPRFLVYRAIGAAMGDPVWSYILVYRLEKALDASWTPTIDFSFQLAQRFLFQAPDLLSLMILGLCILYGGGFLISRSTSSPQHTSQ